MKIYFKYNNKYITLYTRHLQEIGEGLEGVVYSYNNIGVKIKKDNRVGLKYRDAIKIKDVKTERILVPQNLIYSNHITTKKNYIGYTTKLITPKQKNKILYIKPEDLYNEIQTLINDVEILSKNKITIYDLDNHKNFVFDDRLYFVDPGCYEYVTAFSYKEIYNENIKELGEGLRLNVLNIYDDCGFLTEELVETMGFDSKEINDKLLNWIINIYYDYYHTNYRNTNYKNHTEFILSILDKYGSLQKYKYELLKQYLSENNNDSDITKILRKTIK